MTQMFSIPPNTLLFSGLAIVAATIGFVIYGFVRGWKNVLRNEYEGGADPAARE